MRFLSALSMAIVIASLLGLAVSTQQELQRMLGDMPLALTLSYIGTAVVVMVAVWLISVLFRPRYKGHRALDLKDPDTSPRLGSNPKRENFTVIDKNPLDGKSR